MMFGAEVEKSLQTMKTNYWRIAFTIAIYSVVVLGLNKIIVTAINGDLGSSFFIEFIASFAIWFLVSQAVSESAVELLQEQLTGTLEQLVTCSKPLVIVTYKYLFAFFQVLLSVTGILIIASFFEELDFAHLFSSQFGLYIFYSFIVGYFLTLIVVGTQFVFNSAGDFAQIIFFVIFFVGGVIENPTPGSIQETLIYFLPISPGIKLMRANLNTLVLDPSQLRAAFINLAGIIIMAIPIFYLAVNQVRQRNLWGGN